MYYLPVSFADGVKAEVNEIKLRNTDANNIEGAPGRRAKLTELIELPRILQRIEDIKTGKIIGRYCLEPELIEETEYWELKPEDPFYSNCKGKCLKHFKVEALTRVSNHTGIFNITFEFYLSTKELTSSPFAKLIGDTVSMLRFSDVAPFCKFIDIDDLF